MRANSSKKKCNKHFFTFFGEHYIKEKLNLHVFGEKNKQNVYIGSFGIGKSSIKTA